MTDDDKIYEFLVKKDDRTYLSVEPVIEKFSKKIYWECFKKMDMYVVKDAKSFATYKLLVSAPLTKKNLTGYLYSLIKRYYLDVKKKIIYTDDLTAFERFYSHNPDYDNNTIKSEVVIKLKFLLKKIEDENSKSVVSNLIDILNSNTDELNNKIVSLYLLRTTGLHHSTLYSVCKKLNLTLSISNKVSLDKIFDMYLKKYGVQASNGQIIEEWERRAIEEFGDHHERSRGVGFESRNNIIANDKSKRKIPKTVRVNWLKDNQNLRPDELYYQYSNEFGMSYTSFKSDRRKARGESIYQ